MATQIKQHIVTDGVYGVVDAEATAEARLVQSGSDYNMDFLGSSINRVFINDATTVPAPGQKYFGFGADRNTYMHITDLNLSNYNFDFSSGDGYSVDVWFKRTGEGDWATGSGTYYDGIWNYYWNHYLAFRGKNYTGNKIYGTGLSDYDIDMNRWYNVIMTHDNSDTSKHKVYINGDLHQTSTQANAGADKRFYIGNWDSSWACVGRVPICRLYNRPLTAEEVLQNYNSSKSRFTE